jgi:hypothetical protein
VRQRRGIQHHPAQSPGRLRGGQGEPQQVQQYQAGDPDRDRRGAAQGCPGRGFTVGPLMTAYHRHDPSVIVLNSIRVCAHGIKPCRRR